MNVTQSAAGRSRNVESARVFFPIPVNPDTTSEPTPSGSVPGWKFALNLRIWTGQGPKGSAARNVLAVLLWNSDGQGRVWLGIPAITSRAGLGNERTTRKALDRLTTAGWIRFTPQTWSSLTAEQLAVGRKTPRRGDVGQAPHLYTVLASPSPPVTSDLPTRPGLTRTTGSPVDETMEQNCRWDRQQIDQGMPVADLAPDPYPGGSISRKESEQRVALVGPDTHLFSQAQESQKAEPLDAWNLLVHAHAEKTKALYGVWPTPPNLKTDLKQAVAKSLDETAADLAAKLRERGMERDLEQVRQDLAGRVITLYFKHESKHLRDVRHALRDLPLEFDARLIDARQAILRESHDAQPPRRTPEPVHELKPPAQGPKAEKAAEVVKSDAAEKLMPVEVTRELSRRAIELVEANSSKAEPPAVARPVVEEPSPTQKKPVLPDWFLEDLERSRQKAQEPAQNLPDEPRTVQRSIGRPGAPRWGALAPTPTKVRRVSRLQPAEPEDVTESAEPHPRE